MTTGIFPAATTYHRGNARARGTNGVGNVSTAGPSGVSVGGSNSGVFYDTRNPHLALDPLTAAYRGSVLSSTTVSSNQDELMQAYEYGRKHGRLLATGTVVAVATTASGDVPVSTVVNAGNGGSGSSETTDPGICQFTQQPPLPDEIDGRIPNGTVDISRRGGVPSSSRPGLAAMAIASEALPPAFLKRQLSECPSEMTDTYASVDYSAMGVSQSRAIGALRAGHSSKLPTIPQSQQLLAARIELLVY